MRSRLWLSLVVFIGGSAAAETLELANGDRVSGTVVERTDDVVVVEHSLFGRLEVPTADLKPSKPEKPGLFGTDFMEGWTRKLGLGMNGSEGNTINFNLRTTMNLALVNEHRRWEIDGYYVYQTDTRVTTDTNGQLQSIHAWLLPGSRWYFFVDGTYDYDKFKDWKSRISVSIGPGYQLVKTESWGLRASLGLAGQREFSGQKNSNFQGFAGLDLDWEINSSLSLRARNRLYPNLVPQTGGFRDDSKLDLTVKLTEAPLLGLVMGLGNTYESDPAPGDKANDFTYYTTLQLGF